MMKIPKIISNEGREYILVKEYPNHILYQEMIAGYKESFTKQQLGLIKEVENYKKEKKIKLEEKYF